MVEQEGVVRADAPDEVERATLGSDDPGDAADQADRLAMIMTAEAMRNAREGGRGEGDLDGLDLPLEDTEGLLAEEDAEDGSDDPLHAGGLTPSVWLPAEQAAMHVVAEDGRDPGDPGYLRGEHAEELLDDGDPEVDPFDRPGGSLTDEDATLLGIDPYDTRPRRRGERLVDEAWEDELVDRP